MEFIIIGDRLVKYMEEFGDKNVVIPNGVKIIDKKAFFECNKIESVEIPDGVTTIRNRAFACCEKLRKVTIPESVKKIESHVFDNCFNIFHLTLYDNIEKIGENDFKYTSIRSITIKGKKTSVTFDNKYYICQENFLYMSRKIFYFLCLDIDEKEKFVFEELYRYSEQFLLIVYLFLEYGSEKATAYVNEDFESIIDSLIMNNEHELLAEFLPYVPVDKEMLDYFISDTIKLKRPKMQLIFMQYKKEKFDFDKADFDEYMID